MARVKRGVTTHARHKKVLDLAKGYRGRGSTAYRVAIEKVEKALRYAYRDRRNKKRDFRALWIQRINAGVREHGLTYSQFIHGIKLAGRRGSLTLAMRELGALDPEARRRTGAALNAAKDRITAALAEAAARLGRAALEERLGAERADVTLPVPFAATGRIHPINQTIDEIIAIFGEMGFAVAEGPHIEEDFYNFTALNIPPEHPARQEHDTFYLPPRTDGSRLVLRTHTSPVQIRTMLAQKPPLRIIVPGRTFRADHDATHSPM